MTGGEPHPAFPSLPPPSGGSASGSGSSKNLIPLPTSAEITSLIAQSTTLANIRTHLIPALERVAVSSDHTPLLQAEQKLEELGNADMRGLSVALVYILYDPHPHNLPSVYELMVAGRLDWRK